MPSPLHFPADGIPNVFSSNNEFAIAAELLSHGIGPVAIDTERANSFRSDDRAFLIQLRRRGVGTLLLAPEHHREELTFHLAPVLNTLEWILHAAPSDLPSLHALGLYPASIIDTEKAAKLAGFPQPSLGQLTKDILGLELAKGHGRENWSITPLPEDWVIYAALDVEQLIELSEALIEILDQQNKLAWAEEEFEYLKNLTVPTQDPATGRAEPIPLPHAHWRTLKGIGALRSPEQLAIARALWKTRNQICQKHDIAPNQVLKNKNLIAIAQQCATTPEEIAKILRQSYIDKHTRRWSKIARNALASSKASWPKPKTPPKPEFPPSKYWTEHYPHVTEWYQRARNALQALARRVNTPLECIIHVSTVKEIAWECAAVRGEYHAAYIAHILEKHQARAWQVDLIIAALSEEFSPTTR
ncbi:HRDC domain-containing protein [Corynebacterium freiburgense]|uniref:HRDC domain-containing protein n=1 Tax=Corynebacterium freiburgense TaxID=556548 RepID=UPI00041163DC|nr:HRDC domain-containing protein [Corynebacterium freiburgense]WJZ02850.1 Ribonuclease D [Corynebacterium freiburgense]